MFAGGLNQGLLTESVDIRLVRIQGGLGCKGQYFLDGFVVIPCIGKVHIAYEIGDAFVDKRYRYRFFERGCERISSGDFLQCQFRFIDRRDFQVVDIHVVSVFGNPVKQEEIVPVYP